MLVPNNLSQAGWPDRFIQLPNSRIVACELKVVSLTKGGWFNLAQLRQTQVGMVSTMATKRWIGFVLVGINNRKGFFRVCIITQLKWSDWLNANCKQYDLDTITSYRMSWLWNGSMNFHKEKVDA